MIRIAITGPESSGKTTLARDLAEVFSAEYIEEFSRVFLTEKDGDYNELDLDQIAKGQYDSIDACTAPIQICDSDFVVLKIWSNYKYKKVSTLISEYCDKNLFDLHILCTPDVPWEEDELRENQHNRDELFELYQLELENLNKGFIIVDGSHDQRMKKSVGAIASLSK